MGPALIRVKLSEAVQCALALDDERNAEARHIACDGRGWFSATRSGWMAVAEELDGIASGLLYDASDNPGAAKRAAKAGAIRIRTALGKAVP